MITLWGHGNCAGIPRLHSYDDAKKHYEAVVPIRGRQKETKPLGKNRRFIWYTIATNTIANQSENTEYKTYSCKLYDKDTVVFFPNGDIQIETSGWRDITTGMFINCVLNGLGNIVSESGKWYFRNDKNQYFRFNTNMRIRKNAEGSYEPTEIIADVVHRVNRKTMNSLRKKYKDIIDYGRNMLAIDPKLTKVNQLEMSKNGLASNRFLPYHHWQSKDTDQSRTRWFELADKQRGSGDLELLYDLARYVAMSAGRYSYREDTYMCEPNSFANYMDEMIKYQFTDDVFITEQLPIGEVSADRNKKYFNVKVYG